MLTLVLLLLICVPAGAWPGKGNTLTNQPGYRAYVNPFTHYTNPFTYYTNPFTVYYNPFGAW